jgi:hypothetical protein
MEAFYGQPGPAPGITPGDDRLPGDQTLLSELVMDRDEGLEKQCSLISIPYLEADPIDRDGTIGNGKGARTGTAAHWIEW